MKKSVLLAVALVVLAVPALVQAGPPGEKFPEKKWFQNGKGYEEARELQKQTGADLLVYFARYYPNDEEGLCHWWEKRGLQNPLIEKHLRGYLKVKFTYPLKKDDEAMAEPFRVNKCPAVFVMGTNGWRNRISVFDWPNGKPELRKPEDVVTDLRAKSGARYQLPAEAP
jgi:hypothetical protein